MALTLVSLVAGILALGFAADQFVLGASRIAVIRRVPALVVGIVIMGFGTSAPEMLVSAIAAWQGEPEVAVGNIVGSNVANLSLLLGIGALIVPLRVSSLVVRREAVLVVAAVSLFGLLVQGGEINRVEGLVLLAALAGALAIVASGSAGNPGGPVAVAADGPETPTIRIEAWRATLGLLGTVAASQVLLWAALDIAHRAELSEGFVGATIVAIGTSLPELVTVVQSARRNQTDLIVGNLLGSNLFNALAVGGLIGVLGMNEIDAPNLTRIAVPASLLVALAAFAAMATKFTVTRSEGAILVVGYLALIPLLL